MTSPTTPGLDRGTAAGGFTVRCPSHGDASRVAALACRHDGAFGVVEQVSEDDVRDWWHGLDLERDVWLVEREGVLAGTISVDASGPGVIVADGYVDPEFRGRGVGALLVRLSEARAAELAAADQSDVELLLHNGVLRQDAAAHELLGACGYRAVRWFRRMVIELAEPPAPPDWPDGVTVRSFEPARDVQRFHAAREEAFGEHWGVGHPLEEYRGRLDRETFDADLWFLAELAGEIVGVAECTGDVGGRGFVNTLGVRPAWRGRGLGRALLLHAFGLLFARGKRSIALGVDADNPTGALGLYESAGMTPDWEGVVFEKQLRSGRVIFRR